MSKPTPLKLPSQSWPGRHGHDDQGRLINVEAIPVAASKGESKYHYHVVPGLKSYALLSGAATPSGNGGVRGLFAVSNALALAVSGTSIDAIDAFGGITRVGGILGSGPVYFARNRLVPEPQVAIASDGQRLYYQAGSVFPITDPGLRPAIGCDFISAYILFFHADGKFSWTAINDVTNVNSLDFAEAEGRPDGLVRGFVWNNEIWLFGETTTEVWQLTADADAPFQRAPGAFVELGCSAANSVCAVGQRLAWVASDKTVRLSVGYQGQKISHEAVDRAIQDCADVTLIEGHSLTINGYTYLRLSSPSWTWVYNANTSKWFEERSYGVSRRIAAHYMNFNGRHITGDYASGRLLEFDPNADDDVGSPLVARIITAPQAAYPGDVEFNALYLDTLPGTGKNVTIPEIANPSIGVRVSRNGGKSWSSQRQIPTGPVGKYTTRVASHRWGTSTEDGYLWEFEWSPAVRRGILAAALDAVAVKP
jgi:hypothetical protein